MLYRVSYYKSRWGPEGYIDLALTISDEPITKQGMGYYDACARLPKLLPSRAMIMDLIGEEMSDGDSETVKRVLEVEACPILKRLIDDPLLALREAQGDAWMYCGSFAVKLVERWGNDETMVLPRSKAKLKLMHEPRIDRSASAE